MEGQYLLVACARGAQALHVIIEGPLPEQLRRPADGVSSAPVRNILAILPDGTLMPFLSSTNLTIGRSPTASRQLLVASFEAPPEQARSLTIQVIDGETEARLFIHDVVI